MSLTAPLTGDASPRLAGASSGPLRTQLGAVLAAVAVVVGARAGEHAPWLADGLPAAGLVAGLLGIGLVAGLRAHRGRQCVPSPFRRSSPRSSPGEERRLVEGGGDRRLAKAAGVVGLMVLGAVSMARAIDGLDGLPARLAAAGVEGRVTVRLAADPDARWAEARVPARLEGVVGGAASRPPPGAGGDPPAAGSGVVVGRARGSVLVVAKGPAAERLRLLEAGESAMLVGWFRAPAAGERQWRWRHAGAVFEADDLVGAGPAAPALLRAANGVRHRVLAGGAGLSDTDRALVAGFLVGDDRALTRRVAADFRAAGLSHLLVVSGANVTLALALVSPVLRRLGLLGRLIGGVAVLVVFCAMARFEPSVLRAGAMAGLALLAAFLGRPAPGLRLLALAVSGLVLIDPFLTHSVGFGLSCGASAGILLFSRPIARRLPGPLLVRESLAVTAAAQAGVAPFALPVFGRLPLVALPANLAAAPAAAALSLWGLGSGLAGGLLGPAAGSATGGPLAALQFPTALLAGWIRAVAHLAARCPVTIGPRPALLFAVAAVAMWCGSGSGPDALLGRLLPKTGGPRRQVDLQADGVIERQQPRPGDQEGGGDGGVEEVELETAALPGGAEEAVVPLHLGHDEDHLQRHEPAPEAGQ
jgi:competence protein ComEC